MTLTFDLEVNNLILHIIQHHIKYQNEKEIQMTFDLWPWTQGSSFVYDLKNLYANTIMMEPITCPKCWKWPIFAPKMTLNLTFDLYLWPLRHGSSFVDDLKKFYAQSIKMELIHGQNAENWLFFAQKSAILNFFKNQKKGTSGEFWFTLFLWVSSSQV